MNLIGRVVRIAELQTTENQRDSVTEHVLVRILLRSQTDPARARDAIETAVAEGQLVEDGERFRVAE